MDTPNSIIDPSSADRDVWAYAVALKDDDWDHWDSLRQASKFNGCRRSGGRWNLRDFVTGSPVDWDYGDDEVIVLQVLR